MCSLVSGIFSAMANINRLNASKTVIPRAIFSLDSGGKQKTNKVKIDSIIKGKTTEYK